MTQEHPITPPPELFKQWEDDILNERDNVDHVLDCAWRDGFRAGADQELEACCEWMANRYGEESHAMGLLRTARRPKPPSRKQRALDALVQLKEQHLSAELAAEIRRALEALPDD